MQRITPGIISFLCKKIKLKMIIFCETANYNFEILPIYASYNGSEVGNKDYCANHEAKIQNFIFQFTICLLRRW